MIGDLPEYEHSRLWRDSLGQRDNDVDFRPRSQLRVAFEQFRERCKVLAGDVASSLPKYTVHDVSHLDALWGIADIIAGPAIKLNGLEGFILGGAFLLHDLGMAAAAYSNAANIRDAAPLLWDEAMLRVGVAGRDVTTLTTSELQAVHEFVLRENHAQKAEELAAQAWTDLTSGKEYHLIEDPDLRFNFAALIGRLAHSHWWSVNRLQKEFTQTYAPPGNWPQAWTVDALKLAVILRAADAAHIDNRRSPVFLRLTRRIEGVSAAHWTFQQYLSQPLLENAHLKYSSMHAFVPAESRAWWLCYDIINMINGELNAIDSLLIERHSEFQLAARGVLGSNDPKSLARYVPTSGWVPIDARPHITEVPKIIRSLGGRNLYGTDITAPFREMIQNGIDAVQVLHAIVPEQFKSAGIEISDALREDGKHVLIFTDQGVGMSESAIVNGLLDFGNSYWSSDAIREDLPAILGKRPELSARFGIGFYSIFSIGQEVQVSTRRYDASPESTLILEFEKGLDERPLLRLALDRERKWTGGTSISVVLDERAQSQIFSKAELTSKYWGSVETICRYVAPFSVVPITFRGSDGRSVQVADGSTVSSLTNEEILARCASSSEVEADKLHRIWPNMRPIDRNGDRLAIAAINPFPYGVGSPGFKFSRLGIRSGPVDTMAGYFRAVVDRATRDTSTLEVTAEEIHAWAQEQYDLLKSMNLHGFDKLWCAEILRGLAVDAHDFPVASNVRGYLTREQIIAQYADTEFIVVIDNQEFRTLDRDDDAAEYDCPIIIAGSTGINIFRRAIRLKSALSTLEDVVMESIAASWKLKVDDLSTLKVHYDEKHGALRLGRRSYSGLEVISTAALIVYRSSSSSFGDRFV